MSAKQIPGAPHRWRQVRLLLALCRRLAANWRSVEDLMLDLGVSRRTVWRMLGILRAEGLLEQEKQLAGEGAHRVWTSFFRVGEGWWRETTPRHKRREKR